MENFIDTKLEALLGGYHSTLLGANILLSIVLMGKLWYMFGLFRAFSKTSIKELSN